MEQQELERTIEELTETNRKLIKQHSFWRSLVNGVLYGVGATIGATIVIALAVWFLRQLSDVDLLRPAVDNVLPYIERPGAKNITEPRTVYPSPELATPSPCFRCVTPIPTSNPTPETSPEL